MVMVRENVPLAETVVGVVSITLQYGLRNADTSAPAAAEVEIDESSLEYKR